MKHTEPGIESAADGQAPVRQPLLGIALALGLVATLLASCADDQPPVCCDVVAPQIDITAPADQETLRTDPALIQVAASDNNRVSQVLFFVDGELVFTDLEAPYHWNWSWAAVADDAWHTLRVQAEDPAENEAVAEALLFLPAAGGDTVPPTIAFTFPEQGAEVVGSPTLVVTATDAETEGEGIADVRFYANGTPLGTLAAPPYEQLWSTDGLPTGAVYSLVATARDLAGNEASDTVQVTLALDLVPPSVALGELPGGSIDPSEVLDAIASDAGGVARVRFYLDGVLTGIDEEAPYQQPVLALLYWADGAAHDLEAEAEDRAGNRARSASASITLAQPATADLTAVLRAAGPGEAQGLSFARLVRLNPAVRYLGSQTDSIQVDTCIHGNGALIDYQMQGALVVMLGSGLHETQLHIDHCIVINGWRNHSFGGAIEFQSIQGVAYTRGLVDHCTIYRSQHAGIYAWPSQPEHLVIKNNIFFRNLLGGCVRFHDDVSPDIQYNCAHQNGSGNDVQFGSHCTCPDGNVIRLDILDPQERLFLNMIEDPKFPYLKEPAIRSQRAHFALGADSPCRDGGEEGTYIGALPPE